MFDEDALRQEIVERKRAEEKHGMTIHLTEVDPAELTNDDLRMFMQVKHKAFLGNPEGNRIFQEYYRRVWASGIDSRKKFYAYLANLAQPQFASVDIDV